MSVTKVVILRRGKRRLKKPPYDGPMVRLFENPRRWLRNFIITLAVGSPILIVLGHSGSGGYDMILECHYWLPWIPAPHHVISAKAWWDGLLADQQRHLTRNAAIAAAAALGYRIATYHPEKYLYSKVNWLDWLCILVPGVPSIKKRLGADQREKLIGKGSLASDNAYWRTPITPDTTFERFTTIPVTIFFCAALGFGVLMGYDSLQTHVLHFLPHAGIPKTTHAQVPLTQKLVSIVTDSFLVKVLVFVPVFMGSLFQLCQYDAAQRKLIGHRMAGRVQQLGKMQLDAVSYDAALKRPPRHYLLAWRSAWVYYARIVLAGQTEVFVPERMPGEQRRRVWLAAMLVLGLAVVGAFWLWKFA
jgi:hypothetical protein